MLPKRIGINLLYLVPGRVGGTETYARELVRELATLSPETEFVVFCGREAGAVLPPREWPANVQVRTLPFSAANKALRIFVEIFLLPAIAARNRIGLMHSMGTTTPLFGCGTRVVTVHDLIFHHFPSTFTAPARRGLELLVPRGARRANRVIADSQATKDDLIETYAIDPAKIDVVHLGLGLPRAVRPTSSSDLRKRWQLDDAPIVLTVAAALEHKNLDRLLEAFADPTIEHSGKRPFLVIAGHAGRDLRHLNDRADALEIADRIRFTEWLSPEDLEGLYAMSDCFVYPTLREGFGLPVLEAMAREVPVACSNTSSLPEVAGDAALTFDPQNVTEIAAAVGRVLSDDPLRTDLKRRGLQRAEHFTWRASAEATIGTYLASIGRRDTSE